MLPFLDTFRPMHGRHAEVLPPATIIGGCAPDAIVVDAQADGWCARCASLSLGRCVWILCATRGQGQLASRSV